MSQRPEALFGALQFASQNHGASVAMSAILSRTNHGVSQDDLSAEWKRKNPDADQALRLGELDGRLAEVASSLSLW